WIYNISLRMVWEPEDAADITQEILIKVITKLSTFRGQSSFRTWLYRIVSNHVINMKKYRREFQAISFEQYGESLDNAIDMELPDDAEFSVDKRILIEEAKIGCMNGMLLCLDREQRLIYILGELFQVSDSIGSEILGITKVNFRVKLSRAKEQLYNFLNEKCGLIKKSNPCRCARKTQAFIRAGYVDPKSLRFVSNYRKTIEETAREKSKKIENLIYSGYRKLYRQHPFVDSPDLIASLKRLLSSNEILETLNL
ncbi:MAG: RNA polymerase sigma factor, partial [bacterium]